MCSTLVAGVNSDLPPVAGDAPLEIRLFAVEPEVLVEAADLVERLAPDQQAGADRGSPRCGRRRGPMSRGPRAVRAGAKAGEVPPPPRAGAAGSGTATPSAAGSRRDCAAAARRPPRWDGRAACRPSWPPIPGRGRRRSSGGGRGRDVPRRSRRCWPARSPRWCRARPVRRRGTRRGPSRGCRRWRRCRRRSSAPPRRAELPPPPGSGGGARACCS